MSYTIELDHGFEPGQLYQNHRRKRIIYPNAECAEQADISNRNDVLEEDEYFIILEVQACKPLNRLDPDLLIKILSREKIGWLNFIYRFDCMAFSKIH